MNRFYQKAGAGRYEGSLKPVSCNYNMKLPKEEFIGYHKKSKDLHKMTNCWNSAINLSFPRYNLAALAQIFSESIL